MVLGSGAAALELGLRGVVERERGMVLGSGAAALELGLRRKGVGEGCATTEEGCEGRRCRLGEMGMLEADSPNLEKINILGAINFATMAWSFDVTTKTIANCFRHYKIRSEEIDVPEVENGQLEQEIQDLTKLLSKLNYRNVMNVEHLLNYPEENNAVMDSSKDEEIIEAVLDDEANDPEPDDSITIPQVSSREVFQAIVTIKNYMLQHDQNIPEVVLALHKIKDQMNFGGGKKQSTLEAFFEKI
ncbi:uncharacterized protein LOC141705551 [Apium graveolens]|uniref:uncharacterized protein LOC141705551 n=1 Tax=Apium graveolens TaxID=4045 RepID=UPI003D79914C